MEPDRFRLPSKRKAHERARIARDQRARDAWLSGPVAHERRQPDENKEEDTPPRLPRVFDPTKDDPYRRAYMSRPNRVVKKKTLQKECCESPQLTKVDDATVCDNCGKVMENVSTLIGEKGQSDTTGDMVYEYGSMVKGSTSVANHGFGTWPNMYPLGHDSTLRDAGASPGSTQPTFFSDGDMFGMSRIKAFDAANDEFETYTNWRMIPSKPLKPRHGLSLEHATSTDLGMTGAVLRAYVPAAAPIRVPRNHPSSVTSAKEAAAMLLVRSHMHQYGMSENVPSAESSQSSHTVCSLCGGQHDSSDCKTPPPTFHKFMDLAPELRERIYGFALVCPGPVNPHLCKSSSGQIKFHDDRQAEHNAIDKLLGITRVSKQIRSESLPFFYSANTFMVGKDTTTYFDRLTSLGRFHLIRHVRFTVPLRSEGSAAGLLRQMNQYIKEADTYEKNPMSQNVGGSYTRLIHHPQYLVGGIPEINTLIALRKLTTPLSNEDGTYSSKLVLPVPTAERFTSHDRLKWFPVVMYGLGTQIHYVENQPLTDTAQNTISIIWHQKFQKKVFENGNREVVRYDEQGQTEAYLRALEICPDLETLPRPRAWCYMRVDCGGNLVGWCDLVTEGGGVFAA